MVWSTSPEYDALMEEDLRILRGYDVVFLVDDVVSKTLRSGWTDVGSSLPPIYSQLIYLILLRRPEK